MEWNGLKPRYDTTDINDTLGGKELTARTNNHTKTRPP